MITNTIPLFFEDTVDDLSYEMRQAALLEFLGETYYQNKDGSIDSQLCFVENDENCSLIKFMNGEQYLVLAPKERREKYDDIIDGYQNDMMLELEGIEMLKLVRSHVNHETLNRDLKMNNPLHEVLSPYDQKEAMVELRYHESLPHMLAAIKANREPEFKITFYIYRQQ